MAKVLVIGDTHCPGMRRGYVDFLGRVADRHRVDRVVHIGDLVDWCSINFHERHPGNNNAAREYERARKQVQLIAARFPKVDWLIGNHDALTERQAVAVGLPPVVLRDYRSLWGVKWRVHERFVDVDLDCEEARELADLHLPPTPTITGRPSAPNSHRWYIAQGAVTTKHTDPKTKAMIVEMRSTGTQTVVGPSVHPEGEPYDVLTGEPTRVPAPMLTACVASLADAVVKLRHGVIQATTVAAVRTSLPKSHDEFDVEQRAIAYLAALPPAISGQGGHAAAYTAAVALVHGFGIEPERALGILITHYNLRCQPPWTERELRHKVDDAASKPHDYPFGWLRDSPRHDETPVDLSGIVGKAMSVDALPSSDVTCSEPKPTGPIDPGPLPEHLLRMPGFVAEVMDHCLDVDRVRTDEPEGVFDGTRSALL